MVVVLFNILAISIFILSLFRFNIGFLCALLARVVVPSTVRIQIGSFDLNFFDFVLLGVIVSFFFNREYKKIRLPKNIRVFICLSIIPPLILILLSSGIVPYEYQISSFLKKSLLQETIFLIIAYYALSGIELRKALYFIISVSIFAGCYGIFVYFIKINPYIEYLSLIYTGELSEYSYFIEEVRGGLEGRVSGTMSHPLAWGQYWNIVIAFVVLAYKRRVYCNKFFLSIFFIIGFINIILCGSRTAIVALGAILIMVFISLRIKVQLKYIFISVVLLFVFINIIPENSGAFGIVEYVKSGIFFWDSSISEKANIGGSSISMRFEQLRATMKIMLSNPIAGVGYDYQYYAIEKGIPTELLGFESIVFKLIVEQGLLGFLFYFVNLNILRKYTINKTTNSFDYKTYKKYINGYFMSFVISILLTGVQGSSYMFFICFTFIALRFSNNYYDTQNNTLLLAK